MLLCFDLHGHRITACDEVWSGWIYTWKSRCKHEFPIDELKKATACECVWSTSGNGPSCVKKTIAWKKKKTCDIHTFTRNVLLKRVILIVFISISQRLVMVTLCRSVGVSIWFILNRSGNTSTCFETHLANAHMMHLNVFTFSVLCYYVQSQQRSLFMIDAFFFSVWHHAMGARGKGGGRLM